MTLFAQLVLTGVVTGALYAMLGMSFSLIYSVTKVFHFAHVIGYAAAGYISMVAVKDFGFPIWAAAIPAAAVAIGVGVSSELAVYRPMRERRGSLKTVMIASLGLFMIGQNALQMAFGPTALTYPNSSVTPTIIGPIVFNQRDALTVVIGIAMFTAVYVGLRSKAGRAIRAVVDSGSMAEVVGIDIKRVYLLSFIVGSLLVVPPAMLVVSAEGASPWMGFNILFPAVAATIVGGVGSVPGAAIAGFGIGLVQNLLVMGIGNQWQTTIVFVVVILFFMYRPEGLYGRPVAKVRV